MLWWQTEGIFCRYCQLCCGMGLAGFDSKWITIRPENPVCTELDRYWVATTWMEIGNIVAYYFRIRKHICVHTIDIRVVLDDYNILYPSSALTEIVHIHLCDSNLNSFAV